MKAKTKEEKEVIKEKFAVALYLITKSMSTDSIRASSAKIGMEYSHLQRILAGKVDVSLTTMISVLEGMSILTSKLFQVYESLKESEIMEFRNHQEGKKRL